MKKQLVLIFKFLDNYLFLFLFLPLVEEFRNEVMLDHIYLKVILIK